MALKRISKWGDLGRRVARLKDSEHSFSNATAT